MFNYICHKHGDNFGFCSCSKCDEESKVGQLMREVERLREALEITHAALQPNTLAWKTARAALEKKP